MKGLADIAKEHDAHIQVLEYFALNYFIRVSSWSRISEKSAFVFIF